MNSELLNKLKKMEENKEYQSTMLTMKEGIEEKNAKELRNLKSNLSEKEVKSF
jgi:hypothetical protein